METVISSTENEIQEPEKWKGLSHKFLERVFTSNLSIYKIAQEAGVSASWLHRVIVEGTEEVQDEDYRIWAVGKVVGLEPDAC